MWQWYSIIFREEPIHLFYLVIWNKHLILLRSFFLFSLNHCHVFITKKWLNKNTFRKIVKYLMYFSLTFSVLSKASHIYRILKKEKILIFSQLDHLCCFTQAAFTWACMAENSWCKHYWLISPKPYTKAAWFKKILIPGNI